MKVLIVEDEVDLLRSVEYSFRQAGFTVVTTTRGGDVLTLCTGHSPDLVLLDIMLPDVQGTEVCRQLKSDARTKAIPIILVTARGDEVDRVVGFELGADDYVVKPFSVRELLLRARAVLRRGDVARPVSALKVGPIEIDMEAHQVRVDGEFVELTLLEFRLLSNLASRLGRVQTRDMLLEEVWGLSLNVETRTVDTHVKRLREKLGKAGALIQTVRGVGYRMALESEP